MNQPRCSLINKEKESISRRDFLSMAAFWTCFCSLFLSVLGLLRFPKPALLPDVTQVFKIGKREDFPPGTQKIFEDKKVLVVCDDLGLYAVSLICPHLGCVTSKTEIGYECPCHGSRFGQFGDVVQGPAPKSLDWLEISENAAQKLVINAAKKVPLGTRFIL
ncbi:MAG: Rieske 2Fe-2S domain-containing protein [Chlamydiota bacterium]|nr:Rieske 2Fe-2S domain-containing protein [Chlamydiota bacterium]